MNKYNKGKCNVELDTRCDKVTAVDPLAGVRDRVMNTGWNRSLCGLISSREVLQGFSALCRLATDDEFHKFVYYGMKHHLKDIPCNYLPKKYRHDPREWEET